jgi:hypothetical protein
MAKPMLIVDTRRSGRDRRETMAALSPDRWRQIAPHLDRALDLTEVERNSWLASLRDQDPRLAVDIEGLLAEQRLAAADGFLDAGAGDRDRPLAPP